MTITPDKSALAQARERLEAECLSWSSAAAAMRSHGSSHAGSADDCERNASDLRLVLDALAEQEEVSKLKWNNALVCAENAVFEVARSRKNKRTNEFKLPLQEIKAIRALAVDLRPSAKDSQ